MDSNAGRFLDAYTRIEQGLQKIVAPDRFLRFFELIKCACRLSPFVRRHKVDLMEFGELRNAIIHNRTDGRIIAEPDDEVVAAIERIAAQLTEPPLVVPLFEKKVITVAAGDSVEKAVSLLYRHSYSQLPVMEKGFVVALLTTNTIARWLGRALEKGFSMEDSTVRSVLEYVEHGDNFKFIGAGTTLFEVQELFYTYYQRGKRLDAVLITPGGGAAEPLLGIITMRDLPLVQKELS